jgi:hypothetical protein
MKMRNLGTDGPAPPQRGALPERGWDWEGLLADGRLYCVGYRGEAVLIPPPLPVYATA